MFVCQFIQSIYTSYSAISNNIKVHEIIFVSIELQRKLEKVDTYIKDSIDYSCCLYWIIYYFCIFDNSPSISIL